jgi:hypothetical protein
MAIKGTIRPQHSIQFAEPAPPLSSLSIPLLIALKGLYELMFFFLTPL